MLKIKKVIIVLLTILFCSLILLSNCFSFPYPQKEVVGKNVMVCTTNDRTTKIVFDLLKKGWNVVDAAVAANFLMGVYEPAMTGIGGFLVRADIYWAKTGEVISTRGFARAPEKATPDMFEIVPGVEPGLPAKVKDRANVTGFKAPCVPPHIAFLYSLQKKYGTKPWEEVLSPAIKVAEEGFEVTERYVDFYTSFDDVERLKPYPYSVELFLPGGKIPAVGQKIVFKDLAQTMRKIAKGGPDVFYKGEIADTIVNYLQKNGGIITKNDFLIPRAEYLKPSVSIDYRGYRILGLAENHGGSATAQILNILSNFNLKELGYMTPKSIHVMLEAMKIAFTDRFYYSADRLQVPVPLDGLMSWGYGLAQARRIDMNKAQIFERGDPWAYQSIGKELTKSPSLKEIKASMASGDHETTEYVMVDQYGNVLVMVTSLRSTFGSAVSVPGTGLLLNNAMALFDPRPGTNNSIAPFKLPLSNCVQFIVFKDGRPILAIGAPGGRWIITGIAQVLINIIDYGMSLQNAVDAPRVHAEADGNVVNMEARIPESVRKSLKSMGHEVQPWKDYFPWPVVQVIKMDPTSGLLFGYSDTRAQGAAMGD